MLWSKTNLKIQGNEKKKHTAGMFFILREHSCKTGRFYQESIKRHVIFGFLRAQECISLVKGIPFWIPVPVSRILLSRECAPKEFFLFLGSIPEEPLVFLTRIACLNLYTDR
jgi:hypothetical protein